MRYEVKRLDLTIAQEFTPPSFELPSKAAELLKSLYQGLNPRFPLRLEDLRNYGGASYADVKLQVFAFSGNASVDVTVGGYAMNFINLVQKESDLTVLQGFAETVEESMQNVLADSSVGGRAIQRKAWIECEGGPGIADSILQERGNRALDLNEGVYADYEKIFTLGVTCNDRKGLQMTFFIERSQLEKSQLFLDSRFIFNSSCETKDLAAQIGISRTLFEEFLSRLGLEKSAESTS